jgi:hypothetical protein
MRREIHRQRRQSHTHTHGLPGGCAAIRLDPSPSVRSGLRSLAALNCPRVRTHLFFWCKTNLPRISKNHPLGNSGLGRRVAGGSCIWPAGWTFETGTGMSLFGMALPAACCDCRDDEIKKRGCMISPAAGTFGGAAAPASSSTELCGLGIPPESSSRFPIC